MFNFLLTIYIIMTPLIKKSDAWLNVGGGFNLTTFLLLFMSMAWLFGAMSDKDAKIVKTPLDLPLMFLILTTFISIFVGMVNYQIPIFSGSLHVYKRFLTQFFVFWLIANNVKGEKQIKWVLTVLILSVFFQAILTIFQHYSVRSYHYDDDMRIGGTFYRSNELATFLVAYLPMMVAIFFFTKNIFLKLILAGFSFITSMAILYTFSRESYLALGVVLFIFGLFKNRLFLVGLIIVGVFAPIILPANVYERFESIQDTEQDASVNTRFEMWRMARARIVESPVIGHGYLTSRYLLPRDTHNMYFDIAMESGVPALLLLIWFFNRAFFSSLKFYLRTKDTWNKILAISSVCSVAAMALCNFFGTRLTFVPINIYFFILLGMTMRAKFEEDLRLSSQAPLTPKTKKSGQDRYEKNKNSIYNRQINHRRGPGSS